LADARNVLTQLPVEILIRHYSQLIRFAPGVWLRLFVELRGLWQGISVWSGIVPIERFGLQGGFG